MTSPPSEPYLDELLDAEVLILLGHGRRESGLHGFMDDFLDLDGRRTPRTVILLGCWSAHIVQGLSHREVEGLAVSLMGAGTEAVVASLWPVALPAGCEFIAHFLMEASSKPHQHSFRLAFAPSSRFGWDYPARLV
jgi:CHAT domain-containing protein